MDIEKLVAFPQTEWDEDAPLGWVKLAENLSEYEPPARTLKLSRTERKWELVSAYQKSVRRADLVTALRCVSAMDSVPEEWGYFHKRVATTLCEDVGPASPLLVQFAITCFKLFTAKKTGTANYRLVCFLTEMACKLMFRSRIFCSYSIIENALRNLPTARFDDPTQIFLLKWMDQVDLAGGFGSLRQRWLFDNNWRGEGMLKFCNSDLPLDVEAQQNHPRVFTSAVLCGLPSYCYDMHTRIGIAAIGKLVSKLNLHMPDVGKIVGYALFFNEGGLIRDEVRLPGLWNLEQQVVARKFGLSYVRWQEISEQVAQAVADGVVDDYRKGALGRAYGV